MTHEQRTRDAIELLRCPSCGAKAAYTAFKYAAGFYAAVPAFCCDTDGCENSLEGPGYWTPDSSA